MTQEAVKTLWRLSDKAIKLQRILDMVVVTASQTIFDALIAGTI